MSPRPDFFFKNITGLSTIIMESTVMVTALEVSDLFGFPVISGIRFFCSEYLLQNHTKKSMAIIEGTF